MPKAICSLNIEREILEHLKDRAKEEGRSLSNLVNTILQKEVPIKKRKEQTVEV